MLQPIDDNRNGGDLMSHGREGEDKHGEGTLRYIAHEM